MVHIDHYGTFPRNKCKSKDITNKTKNIKKSMRAISTAATAIPVNPKTPAMIAMIKNTTAQCNMAASPFVIATFSLYNIYEKFSINVISNILKSK
jgi:hypothetical protein